MARGITRPQDLVERIKYLATQHTRTLEQLVWAQNRVAELEAELKGAYALLERKEHSREKKQRESA